MVKKKKILLVDDEVEFLDSISERIRLKGFEPLLAHNCEEALAILKKEQVCAAVVDLKMPGKDGLETIKELKEIQPDLHTVLLTGYGNEKIKEASASLDSGYFEKGEMKSFWDHIKSLAQRIETSMAAAGVATHGDLDKAYEIEHGLNGEDEHSEAAAKDKPDKGC